MIIALICAAVAAAVMLVGCVPVPSRYWIESFEKTEVKAWPTDREGNTIGNPLTVHPVEITIRVLHNRSRWVRWLEEF